MMTDQQQAAHERAKAHSQRCNFIARAAQLVSQHAGLTMRQARDLLKRADADESAALVELLDAPLPENDGERAAHHARGKAIVDQLVAAVTDRLRPGDGGMGGEG